MYYHSKGGVVDFRLSNGVHPYLGPNRFVLFGASVERFRKTGFLAVPVRILTVKKKKRHCMHRNGMCSFQDLRAVAAGYGLSRRIGSNLRKKRPGKVVLSASQDIFRFIEDRARQLNSCLPSIARTPTVAGRVVEASSVFVTFILSWYRVVFRFNASERAARRVGGEQ